MKKITLFLVLMAGIFCATSISAQNYKGAVGARLGYPLSLSAKYFINGNHALEGYVGTRGYRTYRWVTAGVGYQIHNPLNIDGIEGLSWYYGAGLNVFFWNFDDNFVGSDNSNTTVGIAGYLGLDYAFSDAPVNLTVDWVPVFFLNGFGNGFAGGYGAIGVRYIFAR